MRANEFFTNCLAIAHLAGLIDIAPLYQYKLG
jgi:hypothetical protein